MSKKILVFLITIILGLGFVALKEVKAGPDENVYGWAWSENIGWISFNSDNCDVNRGGITNQSQCAGGSADYGVHIDPTGLFSGYAWSENIGWISFGDFDADGDIDSDDKIIPGSPCAPNCQATFDSDTKEVSGWARALVPVGVKYEHSDDDLVGILSGTQFYLDKDIIYGSSGAQYAQIFTTVVGHPVNYVSLMLLRAGSPGDVIVSIQRVSLDAPNGDIICKALIDGNNLSLVRPGGPFIGDIGPSFWTDIFLGDCNLQVPDKYAIVVSAPNGSYNNDVHWFFDDTAGYLDGSRVYEEDGEWITENDYLFQIWKGDPLEEPQTRPDPPGWISGGWDGWIKLRGTWADGVDLDTTIGPPYQFHNWAWGGDDSEGEAVVGWISFNCVEGGNDGADICGTSNYKVLTDVNQAPSAIDLNVTEGDYCVGSTPPIYLNWTFYDSDLDDSQNGYQIEIDEDANFGSPRGCPFNLAPYYVDTSGTLGPNYSCAPQDLAFGQTYYWRLKVWDSEDVESSWSSVGSFTTDSRWPQPDFTFSPANPRAGEEIQFTDSSTCAASCSSWVWDFGDGGSSVIQNSTHSYAEAGNYTVLLTVTDANGNSCNASQNIGAVLPLPTWKEIPPF